MFYISRVVGANKYGVVDTEDGVENIMTTGELSRATCKLGIPIEGVTLYYQPGHKLPNIASIKIYQAPESISREQVKLKALKGVDVKKQGDVVVSISVNAPADKPVTIRLSDIGTEFGNYIFSGNKISQGTTIIVDDKIKVTKQTFKNWYGRMILDVRELTNMQVMDYICSDFATEYYIDSKDIRRYVLDNPKREGYDQAVWALNSVMVVHSTGRYSIKNIHDVCPNIDSVHPLISARYEKEFIRLAHRKLYFKGDCNSRFADHVKDMQSRNLLTSGTYRSICKHCADSLFYILANNTTIGELPIRRMSNYIKFFKPSANMQEEFVQMCWRMNLALYEFCMRRHLL